MTIDPSDPSRTVIITGGNTGLGYACARAIAESHPNWHIVIASRNQQQATQAVTTLKVATGNLHIEQMPLDLASLASYAHLPGTLSPANCHLCARCSVTRAFKSFQ